MEKLKEFLKKLGTKRTLTIIVCIIIAGVLAVGGILGLAAGIRRARAVVICDDITIDENTVRYLASYYKMLYIHGLIDRDIEVTDTPEFWASIDSDGRSFGDKLVSGFKDYIVFLAAASSVCEQEIGYKWRDKVLVAEKCEEVLLKTEDGSVSSFNDDVSHYGFDYNDFQNAAVLIYKASRTAEAVADTSRPELADLLETATLRVTFAEGFSSVDILTVTTLSDFYVKSFI